MEPTTATAIDACWKRIGIWGDRSCPELARHTHCRNCGQFQAAAAILLDRDAPDGYREEWTARIARPIPPKLSGARPVVIFRIGREWLALPTSLFSQVAEMRPVHSLPHRRDRMVRGIVDIRGELLLCICLGGLIGFESAPEPAGEPGRQKKWTAYERLLVLSHKSGRVVFAASEVHVGCRYRPEELIPVPSTVSLVAAPQVRYTIGLFPWEGRHVGVLDEELLFYTLSRNLA